MERQFVGGFFLAISALLLIGVLRGQIAERHLQILANIAAIVSALMGIYALLVPLGSLPYGSTAPTRGPDALATVAPAPESHAAMLGRVQALPLVEEVRVWVGVNPMQGGLERPQSRTATKEGSHYTLLFLGEYSRPTIIPFLVRRGDASGGEDEFLAVDGKRIEPNLLSDRRGHRYAQTITGTGKPLLFAFVALDYRLLSGWLVVQIREGWPGPTGVSP